MIIACSPSHLPTLLASLGTHGDAESTISPPPCSPLPQFHHSLAPFASFSISLFSPSLLLFLVPSFLPSLLLRFSHPFRLLSTSTIFPSHRKSDPSLPLLTWSSDIESTASQRLAVLLTSVCSSSSQPEIPPTGMAFGISGAKYLVNAFLGPTSMQQPAFVTVALNFWTNGGATFKVGGKPGGRDFWRLGMCECLGPVML